MLHMLLLCYVRKLSQSSPFLMNYWRVCWTSNTTGVTTGAGTANPSGALSLHHHFVVGLVLFNHLFSLECVVEHCLSVLFWTFYYNVLFRFTTPGYTFRIFKPFCQHTMPDWNTFKKFSGPKSNISFGGVIPWVL